MQQASMVKPKGPDWFIVSADMHLTMNTTADTRRVRSKNRLVSSPRNGPKFSVVAQLLVQLASKRSQTCPPLPNALTPGASLTPTRLFLAIVTY
jgi:hypothetical protein